MNLNQSLQISQYNDSETDIPCEVRFDMPPQLLNNLNTKRLYVSSAEIGNQFLPVFIPSQAPSQQWIDKVVNNLNNINVGTTFQEAFSTYDINSLKYWIASSGTNGAGVEFISHVCENPTIIPPSFILSNITDYYSNPYYWYHEFTHFLKIVENAFNNLLNFLAGTTNTVYCCVFDSGNGASLYLSQEFMDAPNTIYISKELNDLLRFSSFVNYFNSTNCAYYQLVKGYNTTTITNMVYYEFDCLYKSNICPLQQVYITSKNLKVNTVAQLTTSPIINNNTTYDNVILSFNTSAINNPMQFYLAPLVYDLSATIQWIDFSQDKQSRDYPFDLQVWSKLKNGVLIRHYLKPNELFNINIVIQYHDGF